MALTCARRADFPAKSAFPLMGRVGTVFHRAADVPCGDLLVALMTEEAYLHPLAIRIDNALFAHLEPGMVVSADAGGVRIGSWESAWEELLRPPVLAEGRLLPAHAIEVAARIRNVIGLVGHLSDVGEAFLHGRSTEFLEPVETLRACLASGTLDLSIVERWFGGGIGLTPAWDDFCCGILLADRFLGGGCVRPALALIARLAGKTTIQSLWQLRFAERGRSSLLIERFLATIPEKPVRAADILRIAGIGHTSGVDTLSGICLWLESFAAASRQKICEV